MTVPGQDLAELVRSDGDPGHASPELGVEAGEGAQPVHLQHRDHCNGHNEMSVLSLSELRSISTNSLTIKTRLRSVK